MRTFGNSFWKRLHFKLLLETSTLLKKALIHTLLRRPVPFRATREAPYKLVYFACQRDFPELLISIRSFFRYVGQPRQTVVVSDGSLSSSSQQLLSSCFRGIEVIDWQSIFDTVTDTRLHIFANRHPLGKKLGVLMHFSSRPEPFFFSDTDIIFFPQSASLLDLVASRPLAHLVDCGLAIDQRIEVDHTLPPVNSGFLVCRRSPDWQAVLKSIPPECFEGPTHHTEQTIVHRVFQQADSLPLPVSRYLVSLHDQYSFRPPIPHRSLALRHYVQPVRHKFWLLPPLWYLALFGNP